REFNRLTHHCRWSSPCCRTLQPTLLPSTTLIRSPPPRRCGRCPRRRPRWSPGRTSSRARTPRGRERGRGGTSRGSRGDHRGRRRDRKSTRLNSSHVSISYAVFCLKKNNNGEVEVQ